MRRSKDSWRRLAPSFQHVGSPDRCRITRLGDNAFAPEHFPGVDGDCFLVLTEVGRPFCGTVHSLPKGAGATESLHPALFPECVLNVTSRFKGLQPQLPHHTGLKFDLRANLRPFSLVLVLSRFSIIAEKKVTKTRDCPGLLEYAPKLTYGIARCISCPDLTLDFKVKGANVMPKKE